MMERNKLESSRRKGMEYIEDSMDPKVKEEHEEEHEDSKKEIKSITTSYYTKNHKTTSMV
jgi:hypothetical protein